MALNIKSPEADRLARELTAATGESLTTAVETALRERLDSAPDPIAGDRHRDAGQLHQPPGSTARHSG